MASCSNLLFPNDMYDVGFFCVLICHLYVVFGKVSVQIFCSLFNSVAFLLLSFKS